MQIIITFNPVSATHWIKKTFFDSLLKDTFILKTTYLDNPFITEDYKKVMERLKRDNEIFYKIYALGEWGSLKGLIYPDYEVVEDMPEYFEDEYVGLDFGYNHLYTVVHIRIDGRNLYIDELVYVEHWVNSDVAEYLANSYEWVKNLTIYADTARPDLINEYDRRGFYIEKAIKTVFDGIITVKGFKMFITKRSVNIIKELGLYCWKEDKDGNKLDEPIKNTMTD